MGPVYNVDHQPLLQNIEKQMSDLNYPVYDVQRAHKFNEIHSNLIEIKTMSGPVYTTEHDHHFNEIGNIINDLKTLSGPVYSVETQHKFNLIVRLSDIK